MGGGGGGNLTQRKPKWWGSYRPPCTTVGVWVCLYVRGLKRKSCSIAGATKIRTVLVPHGANPSMKIQWRLDHLSVSSQPSIRIYESKIIPNIYSDHSAVVLSIFFSEHEPPSGPGFWNLMFSDAKYVKLLNFLILQLAKKHQGTEDKGFFWEMNKMEIRTFTIKFSKQQAKSKRDEEYAFL